MKKKLKSIVIGLIVTVALVSNLKIDARQNGKAALYYEKYYKIMSAMEEKMAKLPRTGDINIDFLTQMVVQAEAGVDLAENALQYVKNPKVVQFAKNMVKVQRQEKEDAQCLAEKMQCNIMQVDDPQHDVTQYQTVALDMQRTAATGNIDNDFLEQMIAYHEAVVEMAIIYNQSIQAVELERIAREIMALHNEQIQQIKAIQNSISQIE